MLQMLKAASGKITIGGVYLVEAQGTGNYKVGRVADIKYIFNRINSMQTSNPAYLDLVLLWSCRDPLNLEREAHERLDNHCIRGEWFHLNDDTYADFMEWIEQQEGKDETQDAKSNG